MGVTSVPRLFMQLLAAAGLIGPDPFRMLITGQIGSDGGATSGATYQDVESMTDAEVKSLFGSKSYLTHQIVKARSICKSRFPIWVIALDPAAGTAATNAIVYAGTATEDRVMTVEAISKYQYSFNVSIETGDTGTDVATKVKAGLDALVSTFPASSVDNLAGTVTLTASDVGTLGNKYTVKHTNIPAGVTVNGNEKEDRSQFASGATDPTVTGIFDNVSSTRFHVIAWPWQDDFTEVKSFLEGRNVINNAFLHGVAYIGYSDTEANISSKVNGVTPLNSPNLFFMGNRVVDGARAIIEPDDWMTVEFAAIEGLRLTDGVPIGQYVATSAPLDTVGGGGTASLGYYSTPLAQTSPTPPDLLFDEQEQQNLADDGYTIIGVDENAATTIMGEVISTYKFDAQGLPNTSFKYLNYIRTGFLALEIFFKTLKSTYKQFRLTSGAKVAGRAIENQDGMKAKYAEIYNLLAGPDYTLTQAGGDAEKYFFSNLTVTLDLATGSVTSSGDLPIVTQFREGNVTFQLAFSVGG